MKINLTTLGCPKNIVDSEVLLGGLKGHGVELVDNAEEAETIILNTCGFIQGAKEESIDAILQAVELKKSKGCERVFVTGCLSQRYQQELIQEIPEVDGFYGNRDMTRILKQLLSKLDLKRELLGERALTTPRHYAYLKISEGCENPCTFCSIPGIRGNFRSQPIETLVEEAHLLAEKGVQELILIAQDSTVYGHDLYGKKKIVPLLDKLSEINEFKWIRLLYTFPANFSDDLIEIIADKSTLINYVDMPIQHISNRLLKRMARKVTSAEIKRIIEKIRTRASGVALRTTLIVGFPGETEGDCQELSDFLGDAQFDRLGIFTYSREENTPAYFFSDQIPDETKHARWAELNDTQNEISRNLNQKLVGKPQTVLIDGFDEELGAYVGRTSRDCPEIDGSVHVKGKVEIGNFYNVRITDYSDYDLNGEIIQ